MNKQAVRYPILLLDADDTLFDFQAAEQNALQRLLDEVHYPYTVNTLFQYRNINEDLWRRHEAGEITKEELQATRFTRFFDALSISGDGLAANNRYLEHLSEQGCLVNGALEVCRKLSAFCRLYIVTNGISRVQRRRLELSPLKNVITDIFISEDTGSQKPQIQFFDYVFARIPNFRRKDALIVGDSLTSDVQGGINAGIDTCWFNGKGLDISGGITPTYEIALLQQLSELIFNI